jgi:hypothetical protein
LKKNLIKNVQSKIENSYQYIFKPILTMKRLHTGIILLDGIDILCISFSAGSILAYSFKKYQDYKKNRIMGEDKIVDELKKKSPIIVFSEKDNPVKLPLMRGGDNIRAFSLMIKNKKLVQLMMAIINARKNQKKLKLLQDVLFILNGLLTNNTGLRIATGGSLNYAQIILIAFPSTIGGFLMGIISAYPLASAVLPIAILFGRGIEDIPDPYEKCRFICKAAEKYHNQQLMLEMENMDSLLVDAPAALQFPIDKGPLLCIEQPLSLLERYKLREVIKSVKAQKRVQHFQEFIKKLPECDPDPESIYEEIIGNVEKISVKS